MTAGLVINAKFECERRDGYVNAFVVLVAITLIEEGVNEDLPAPDSLFKSLLIFFSEKNDEHNEHAFNTIKRGITQCVINNLGITAIDAFDIKSCAYNIKEELLKTITVSKRVEKIVHRTNQPLFYKTENTETTDEVFTI